jgi:2'-5' RNA ligase
MNARPDARLYLFARLPDAVSDHLEISNDIAPVLPGLDLVSVARRHITIADLDVADVPEDFIVALVGWIMATMPPFAFRVVFDQLVTSARSTLLKASRPLTGALGCQAYLVETARHYGLDLTRQAAPSPHVTLGYSYAGPRGVRPIDGISWLVDELVLVRSWHGRTWHEELGRWTLPPRRSEVA